MLLAMQSCRMHSFLKTKLINNNTSRSIQPQPSPILRACQHSKLSSAMVREDRLMEALNRLRILNHPGAAVDVDAYASLLQACANTKALAEGKQIHAHICSNGVQRNVSVGAKLLSMYANCGRMDDARLIFDKMPKRNLFSWNWMIGGYAGQGHCEEALVLYYQMHRIGVQPNKFTFPCVLKACASLAALQQGKEIHECIIKSGFESDTFVANALIDTYAKCGHVRDARQVFDKMPKRDVASWTTMIAGYTHSGSCDDAFDLFRRMELEHVKPNEITWNAMIAGFSQNGLGEESLKLFIRMQQVGIKPDVVTWNAMIAGHNQSGQATEGLKLFCQMQLDGAKPNPVTIASILPACALGAALQQGKQIHGFILRNGFECNVFVGNALIDMYAKCGSMKDAWHVFDKMSQRTVVSWNAIIACCGIHGDGESAITHFGNMQQAGIKPNYVTFTCVLSACSRAGLVDEGWQCFTSMTQDYHIKCRMEHYACMVDLLGRAGRLVEAHDFIKNMPLQPRESVWGAFLGACRIHFNMELAECAAEHILELKPKSAGIYVLMSNIYAMAGRWADVAMLRKMMKDSGLKKKPGCSWVETKNRMPTFLVEDRLTPKAEKVYAMLESLANQAKAAGNWPQMNSVLYCFQIEKMEHALLQS